MQRIMMLVSPGRKLSSALAGARNEDAFMMAMETELMPEPITRTLAALGLKMWSGKAYGDDPVGFGGTMTYGVSPHVDDHRIAPGSKKSVVFFPRVSCGELYFYQGKRFEEVKSGDVFVFDSRKDHAVLQAGQGTWTWFAAFLVAAKSHPSPDER